MSSALPHLFVDYENLQPAAEDFVRLHGVACRLSLFHGSHQNRFAADVVAAWLPLGEMLSFVQCAKSGKNALDFHIAFALGQALQHDAAAGVVAHYVVVSRDTGFDTLLEHMRSLGARAGRAKSIADALTMAGAAAPAARKSAAGTKASRGASGTKAAARKSAGEAAPPAVPRPAASKRPAAKSSPAPAPAPAAPARATASSGAKPRRPAAAPRAALAADDTEKVTASLLARPRSRPADREALQRHIVSVLKHKVTTEVGDAVIRELEQRGLIGFSGNKVRYELSGTED